MEPKNNHFFIGHEREVKALEALFASRRAPHAFLLSGTKGIGKATLAYRLARFILKGGLDSGGSNNLFGEPEIDFGMDKTNPIFAKIAGKSHPDLLILETDLAEEKKEITIDEVRKISSFLKMSSAESGWRAVIIDSIDEMNRNSANALLKILEEPTQKSLLFLISHSPGRLLPTIRSRCNLIKMNPLPENQIKEIFAQLGVKTAGEEAEFAILAADGTPGLAITLINNAALEIYNILLEIISLMPEPDISQIINFSERFSGKNQEEWDITAYLLNWFLARAAKRKSGAEVNFISEQEGEAIQKMLAISSIDKLTNISSGIQEWVHSDEIFHLDRRVIITDIFNLLKKAA